MKCGGSLCERGGTPGTNYCLQQEWVCETVKLEKSAEHTKGTGYRYMSSRGEVYMWCMYTEGITFTVKGTFLSADNPT